MKPIGATGGTEAEVGAEISGIQTEAGAETEKGAIGETTAEAKV